MTGLKKSVRLVSLVATLVTLALVVLYRVVYHTPSPS